MTTQGVRNHNYPLITIGITCFNAEETISRAINSALNQDWKNFEIIIVNDKSTDKSGCVINEFIDRHKSIRLINHDVNKGCAASRNRIIKESKGKYVTFFDDDDFSYKERLSIQYKRIVDYEYASGEAMIVCYSSGVRYYPNYYKMPIEAIGSKKEIPKGLMVADYLLMFEKIGGVFYGGGTPSCTMMASVDVYKKVGDFDINLKRQEDADFAIRLAFMGGHFIGTEEVLVEQYATFSNDKTSLIEYESSLGILIKNKSYLEKYGLYNYMMKWVELKHYYHDNRIIKAIPVVIYLLMNSPVKFIKHFFESGIKRMIHDTKINKMHVNIFF